MHLFSYTKLISIYVIDKTYNFKEYYFTFKDNLYSVLLKLFFYNNKFNKVYITNNYFFLDISYNYIMNISRKRQDKFKFRNLCMKYTLSKLNKKEGSSV